jgi:hypothetical protein
MRTRSRAAKETGARLEEPGSAVRRRLGSWSVRIMPTLSTIRPDDPSLGEEGRSRRVDRGAPRSMALPLLALSLFACRRAEELVPVGLFGSDFFGRSFGGRRSFELGHLGAGAVAVLGSRARGLSGEDLADRRAGAQRIMCSIAASKPSSGALSPGLAALHSANAVSKSLRHTCASIASRRISCLLSLRIEQEEASEANNSTSAAREPLSLCADAGVCALIADTRRACRQSQETGLRHRASRRLRG